jgi:hypothetical protein
MALYIMDQKVFIIETFYSSGGSCIAVERQYHEEASAHVPLSRERQPDC